MNSLLWQEKGVYRDAEVRHTRRTEPRGSFAVRNGGDGGNDSDAVVRICRKVFALTLNRLPPERAHSHAAPNNSRIEQEEEKGAAGEEEEEMLELDKKNRRAATKQNNHQPSSPTNAVVA